MHFYKLFTIKTVFILFVSCNGTQKSTSSNFSIQLEGNKNTFQLNQEVKISINNKKNIVIDSIQYTINSQLLSVEKNILKLENIRLGKQLLTAQLYSEGKSENISKEITILANKAPSIYTYEVVNEYPHDIKAYTQGLEFYNDTLYESTGRNGQSSLRKVHYKTGDVIQKIDLDNAYFGEGITIINNKILQLTWQNRTGFVYDANSLKKTGSFAYGKSKEGWGLCNNGSIIYKSDGTEKIWLLNAETLAEEDFIQTVTNTSVFNKANELEYVNGKIYANVYQKESMMIINPETGAIEGVVNFGGLKEQVTQHADLDVLNGVAYNPKTNTFFVTGKNWDKLFEVNIFLK